VRTAVGADALDELIHRSVVERLLLVAVVVILVAGEEAARIAHQARRAAVETLRRRKVRVVREERGREPVHRRCPGDRGEWRSVGVRSLGIGAEVVIEGDVLLEDHDEMLDRRRRLDAAALGA
jgi:hypothetical protein